MNTFTAVQAQYLTDEELLHYSELSLIAGPLPNSLVSRLLRVATEAELTAREELHGVYDELRRREETIRELHERLGEIWNASST